MGVARRILDRQPRPPRHVAWADLWEVYSPVVVLWFALAGFFATGVFLFGRRIDPFSVRLYLFAVIAVVLIAVMLILRQKRWLETGVAATAQVIAPSDNRGRYRFRVGEREIVTSDNLRAPRTLFVGDRITVLLNPMSQNILLTLGLER